MDLTSTPPSFDALVPAAMAQKAEDIGVSKAGLRADRLAVLSLLAGAFIGFGGMLSVVATTGSLPYGVGRVFGGLVFCLGLILVVVGGAELFTGNMLIVMAVADRRVKVWALLRNWAWSYAGNLVGAVGLAYAVYLGKVHEQGKGAVGARLLTVGDTKAGLDIFQAFVLGILANVLVCLAVWLCFSARTVIDKIAAIIFPITAFVAMGFEHSIANLFLLPAAMFVKDGASDAFWTNAATDPSKYPNLTWGDVITHNVIPVTLGNMVGGALLVGLVYWFVYLRKREA